MSKCSQQSFAFSFSRQNPVFCLILSRDKTLLWVKIMKRLIIKFSPVSCDVLSLTYNYSIQHPVLVRLVGKLCMTQILKYARCAAGVSLLILMVNFFLLAQQPQMGQGLLIHDVSRSHTTTHHSQYDSSGRVISSSRSAESFTWQNTTLTTDIHAPGGIRIHHLSRWAAANLHLRPRGYRDRQFWILGKIIPGLHFSTM
jgi:hypothetical protein